MISVSRRSTPGGRTAEACIRRLVGLISTRPFSSQEEARQVFEGRFKGVAILDEESLLATCAYIDLNPVAAGIAQVPEASEHTSIKERVDHVKAQGPTDDLKEEFPHDPAILADWGVP